MLRLAEEGLRRLFRLADNAYLGLVSPVRHYTPKEIARTAELARARPTSAAAWPSDLILEFTGDVRAEFARAADPRWNQGPASSQPRRPMVLVAERLLPDPPTSLDEDA
jgi:hypothetical protein